MPGVFEGYTVIELADRRNQFAGKLLADGGARVIQIEPPSGSPGRWCGPFVDDKPDPDRCLDYWYHNTGKESLALDLTSPAAQELVRRLARSADIVLESTRPGTLRSLGLDYEMLAKAQPALIYASLTDFGQNGPWLDFEMNDIAHLALGGQMASSGYSDLTATPIAGQGHQAWNMGCVFTVQAITMALYSRLNSNEGQHIDCAIHDCCAICTERAVSYWLNFNDTFYRQTGQHAGTIRQPTVQVRAADGRYVIASVTHFSDNAWIRFVEWMQELGVAGDLADAKYRDGFYRAQQFREQPHIREAVAKVVAQMPAAEAAERGQALGLAWAMITAPEENYAIPHYQQRQAWREIEHKDLGKTVPYPRGFFLCDELGMEPRGRAPNLGEHTAQILANDLGLDEVQIQSLIRNGVAR